MIKKSKPIRIGITIQSKLVQEMKDYLKKVNEDKSLKYVSQSEFANEAIKQLLEKELENEKVNNTRMD